MLPRTHLAIDRGLCGEPLDAAATAEGTARVALTTLPVMASDAAGLVHGGFVFGLADHAAMLAVNDPNVVLGSAAVRFLAPVAVGERLVAEARREEPAGRRSRVLVEVRRAGGTRSAPSARPQHPEDAERLPAPTRPGTEMAPGEPDGQQAPGEVVMSGEFVCFTLERHVLDRTSRTAGR